MNQNKVVVCGWTAELLPEKSPGGRKRGFSSRGLEIRLPLSLSLNRQYTHTTHNTRAPPPDEQQKHSNTEAARDGEKNTVGTESDLPLRQGEGITVAGLYQERREYSTVSQEGTFTVTQVRL